MLHSRPTFRADLPIFFQLGQFIRSDIMRGVLPTGCKLEPELQLASRYGVSAVTVQRALRGLEEEGLITRQRGRGTFVCKIPPELERPMSPSAMEMMFSDEFGAGTEVLERGLVRTPKALEGHFGREKKVLRILRLVRVGDDPWSYTTHYVLPEFGAKITLKLLRRYPVFRILREHCGVALQHVDINLEATTAPHHVSHALAMDSIAPVMFCTAALYDQSGRVVNVPEMYFRGDRFNFRFNMTL
jgi:GntR family transcriptional regulator